MFCGILYFYLNMSPLNLIRLIKKKDKKDRKSQKIKKSFIVSN